MMAPLGIMLATAQQGYRASDLVLWHPRRCRDEATWQELRDNRTCRGHGQTDADDPNRTLARVLTTGRFTVALIPA
jgi:hypothetical protein